MLRLARLAISNPKATLAVWVVVAGTLVAIGLGISQQLSPSVVAVPGSGSSHAQTLADKKFGPSVLVPILLQGPARQLDAQGPYLVLQLSQRSDSRVMSAWSSGSAAAALRPSPTAAMIVVSVARSEASMVRTQQAQIDRLVRSSISSPVTASITGQPTLDRGLRDEAISSTRSAELLAIGVLFLLLLVLLASPLAAAVIALFGATTVFVSFGLMALLGRVIEVDPTAIALGSMTGLALGVGYSMMLLRRFREEQTAADSRAAAARAASASVATTGRAVLYAGTALTLSLLLATAIAPTVILTSLGIGVLLCTVVSVGGAIAVLPAVLVLAGHHLDVVGWMRPGFLMRPWARLVGVGDAVVRRPLLFGVAATGLLLALAVPLIGITTGPPDIRQLPASSTARQSFETIARVMGPGWATPYNVLVVSGGKPITTKAMLTKIGGLQRQIARDPRVDSVVGPGTFLAQTKDLAKLPAGLDESARVAAQSKIDLLKLRNGLGEAGAGALQLRTGLTDASTGAGALKSGSGGAQAGAGQIKTGLSQARTGAGAIAAGLATARAGAISLRDGARQALAGSKQLQTGLGTGKTTVTGGLPLVKQMAIDIGTASRAIAAGRTGAAAAAANIDQALTSLRAITGQSGNANYNAALAALATARASAGAASATLGDAAPAASSATGVAAAFSSQVSDLATGLSQLYAGSTSLTAGIAKLESGNSDLAGGLSKLNVGGGDLTSGLTTLRNGAGALESGLGQLTTGSGQLQSGLSAGVGPTSTLATGLGTMEAAVAKARSEIPSTKDLEALNKQSPGLFDSGYFVLAAIQGASPSDQAQAGFALNLDRGGNAGQIVVIAGQPASAQSTQDLGTDLRKLSDRFARATGTTTAVGGPAGNLADFRSVTESRIWILVPVVAIAVMLFLMFALRAVLLPMVAVLFDVLTVAAAFGVLTLLFRGSDPVLGGPGYLDPMSIIGIFAVMFGITATYEVLLLVRARAAFVRLGDADAAMRFALRATAATATGAGLVMIAAVIPFAFSDLIPVRQFGIGIATAVILDAFIVRPLVLPAAASLLGRRGWWPTRPAVGEDSSGGGATAARKPEPTAPQPIEPAPEPRVPAGVA
jgi:RND superfamily putative drug exporter